MASLINSARTTGIALLTTVSKAAETITDSVDSAQKGMDILHSKVRVAHAAQTQNTDIKIEQSKHRDLVSTTIAHAQFITESEKTLAKDENTKAVFDELMSEYTKQPANPSTTEEDA